MAIVLSEVKRDVLHILNASTLTASVGSTSSADEKFPDDVVLAACTDALNEFGALVASVPNHPEQTQLMQYTAALVHKTQLSVSVADKVGNFLGCRVTHAAGPTPADSTYEAAKSADPEEIRFYVGDVALIGVSTPWYKFAVSGGFLYHTGTFAKLGYIPSTISAANVPAKYRNGIICLALARLLPFEGNPQMIGAAQHFKSLAEAAMERIKEGTTSPQPTPYTAEVAA